MKPLYLEIQAFGPYVEKQIVDFETLGQKGIFLIKGKTGSGKTSIFDAMTFALYGGGSGENEKTKIGRNDLKEWRCTQADTNIDTIVSFTFSVREHKYKFTRSLTQNRVNLAEKYDAGAIDENGNFIPFFNNPKKDDLTRKAEELIGLTKEQFRQVVLLPQGQFERFLTADSGEKEEILKKIFGAEQWGKYAEVFYDDAFARKKELDNKKSEIERSLSEEKLKTIDELKQRIVDLNEEAKAISERHAEFAGEDKQKKLNEDIKLSEQFAPLHSLENTLKKLSDRKDDIEIKRNQYIEAEKAEQLRAPINDYEQAEKEAAARKDALDKINKMLPDARQKKENAEKAKHEHEKNSPIEELNKQLGLYESKKDTYDSIEPLRKTVKDCAKKLENAKKVLETSEQNLSAAVKNAKDLKSKRDYSEIVSKEYRDRYYAGIYGEIAEKLKDGEKCPVCGSPFHPEPAVKLPDSVSKVELENQEKALDNANRCWNEAESCRVKAEKERDENKKAFDGIQLEYTKADSDFTNAAKNLIEGIADTEALSMAVNAINEQLMLFDTRSKELQLAVSDASNKLTELEASIKNATEEYDQASDKAASAKGKLYDALQSTGFENYESAKSKLLSENDRRDIHKTIVEYETSFSNAEKELKDKQKELKDKIEPDKSKFEDRQNEITRELSDFNKKTTEIKTTVERLSAKFTKLSKEKAHFDENIHKAESDLAFAKKLRGVTGIGIQRYVLAIMFNQVIGEANRMLSKVHGGRYHLFRTDDKGTGNKRGLELKVHDNRSPEKGGRGVGMLSGGEKFLVSLALSIGMSTVAQKSGVQIEALFIDEGFGTLDDSSIHDAMDILDSVRKGTGTIGIISHVQLLEANIPTHLNVVAKETGSVISIE